MQETLEQIECEMNKRAVEGEGLRHQLERGHRTRDEGGGQGLWDTSPEVTRHYCDAVTQVKSLFI